MKSSPEELLETETRETIARIAALTLEFDDVVAGASDANTDDEHDPEGSTIAFERARASALLRQARAHLTELERAQERIVDHRYGICERCSATIPFERLAARPTARTCVRCRPTEG
jgi:DnaK suppressor protein